MKRGTAVILAVLLALPFVCADTATLEIHHVEMYTDTPHFVDFYVTGMRYGDAKVTVTVPELGLQDISLNDPAYVSLYIPVDTPSGDYLARIVLSNDNTQDVVYRWFTVY
jgi:hypothetical protein